MSIKNLEVEFSTSDSLGVPFTGIRELGFDEGTFIVSAWTTPAGEDGCRGWFFTTLSISPLSYRLRNRTLTSYRRDPDCLIIHDDWCRPYKIYAPSDILDTLVAECEANGIPKEWVR